MRRATNEKATMSRSPFLNDPHDQLAMHIAAAVASPVEDVRAIHIRAAEHLAQLAKENGVLRPSPRDRVSKTK
jgi:hypothetical protein